MEERITTEGSDTMKIKRTAKKVHMTDDEIQEAIRRDKEWMENIDPEVEIVVSEDVLKDIFGDEEDVAEDDDSDGPDCESEPGAEDDSSCDIDDDNDDIDGEDGSDDDEDDDEVGGGSGAGGVLGAITGGVCGALLGGILGVALLDG